MLNVVTHPDCAASCCHAPESSDSLLKQAFMVPFASGSWTPRARIAPAIFSRCSGGILLSAAHSGEDTSWPLASSCDRDLAGSRCALRDRLAQGQPTLHELGIRMALGAAAPDVLRMVLVQGLKLASLGTGIDLTASFSAARLMSSLLYGVRPTDPFAFAASATIVLLVALGASYGPARRALKLEPLAALRCE